MMKSKAYYFIAALLATIAVCPLLTIYLSINFISDQRLIAIVTNPIFGIFLLILVVAAPSLLVYFSGRKIRRISWSIMLLPYYVMWLDISCYSMARRNL
jgi:hypothetical protein